MSEAELVRVWAEAQPSAVWTGATWAACLAHETLDLEATVASYLWAGERRAAGGAA